MLTDKPHIRNINNANPSERPMTTKFTDQGTTFQPVPGFDTTDYDKLAWSGTYNGRTITLSRHAVGSRGLWTAKVDDMMFVRNPNAPHDAFFTARAHALDLARLYIDDVLA